MEQYDDPETRARGERLMQRAHLLTEFRDKSSPLLGAAVALTEENWTTTAIAGVELVTDVLDGRDARAGAKLLGIETSAEGAESDPRADKKFMNSLMGGLVLRFIRQQDYTSATVMGANALVSQWRDQKMAIDRTLVKQHDIDPAELKAKKINKIKMGAQAIAGITLMSPLARNRTVRNVALGVLSAGTAAGIIGERQYRRRVHSLIAASNIRNARKG